ncbi:hypothetical protein JWG45_03975 [Leptospira sp. 201903070]|jgi:hypothetical protein|uniref:Lipoprotein n=1 Tax=Leptospira ainlahdjerensis TaxID=2810033 RepID=A0ABS2U7G6_9LEPT|nr:hypothetical protein [Leptospira ainlahdjerensis]MBM9576306.1 hypothetical protein [Leptospira ainlahdjerensis]
MSSAIFKIWIALTILSIFILIFDCGPVCELDFRLEDSAKGIQSSSPCHQEQNSEEAPGCEWDFGSIALSETDSESFKLLKEFFPLHYRSGDLLFFYLPIYYIRKFLFDDYQKDNITLLILPTVRLLI